MSPANATVPFELVNNNGTIEITEIATGDVSTAVNIENFVFSDGTVLAVEDIGGPVNTDPVAVDDSFSFSQNSGTFVPAPGVFVNDTDADGDDLTVIAVNGDAANVGVGQISPSGIVNVSILEDGGYFISVAGTELGDGESVTETITYTISDGNGGTDTATVSVTVNGQNDDPDAVDDAFTVAAGETVTDVQSLILANDSDVDGDDISLGIFDLVFADNFGDVASVDIGALDGEITDFEIGTIDGVSGTTSFTYTVSDGNGGTDTATVTIEIEAPDIEPNLVLDFEDAGFPNTGTKAFLTGEVVDGFTFDGSRLDNPAGTAVMIVQDWTTGALTDDLEAITGGLQSWTLTRGGDSFDFISGEFASGQGPGSPENFQLDNLTVLGLRDGSVEFSQDIALSKIEMTPVDFNFTNIDELVFLPEDSATSAASFAFDDLAFIV